jgi:hypothetical protein
MNHQDLATIDEGDALLFGQTPKSLRYEVTDGGTSVGE